MTYGNDSRNQYAKITLVTFLYSNLNSFVHSFKSSIPVFKQSDINFYKNGHRDVANFVTIKENDIGIISDTNKTSTKVVGNLNAERREEEKFREPDYCYVNFNDVSIPYVSREESESTFVQYTNDGLCLPAGPIGQWKEAIANFLTEPSTEIFIALVVLLNSSLVAISTLDSLTYLLPYIRSGEIIIEMLFFVDFIARWFSSSRNTFGFVLDSEFVVDILVVILPLVVSTASLWQSEIDFLVLPTALAQPSGLFNLKLLRVLRLQRFLQDLNTFERFVERALGTTKTNIVQDYQLQLARVVLSLFTLISVSTGLIYTAEQGVNQNINNYFDALYFGLTTLTTVGFGDISPVTTNGRLVVCGSIVLGVAIVPAQTAALLEALLDRENLKGGSSGPERRRQRENRIDLQLMKNDDEGSILALDTIMTCPRCGSYFHWSGANFCYKCGEKIRI